MILFGSVCSGIEAASEALCPLGWSPAYYSEIEPGPIAVLKHRHNARDIRGGGRGGIPLFGDFASIRIRHMRRFGVDLPDVLVGGTPCQSFSIAGKRLSLADDRGNLALAFVRHAHAIDAVRERQGKPGLVVLWENVPGVQYTEDNAFGCLLAGFVGADSPLRSPLERGRWPDAGMVEGPRSRAAWRVLDAQYFGLAQRRERLFLVVSFRNGPDPAQILFEPRGMFGNSPPSRETRESIAGPIGGSSQTGGFRTADLDNQGAFIPEIAWALQERDAKGADSSTKDGHLIVEPVIAFTSKDDGRDATANQAPTLRAMNNDKSNSNGGGQLAVAFKPSHFTRDKDGAPSDVYPPLSADADKGDQDPVVFQTRIARNGRGQPENLVPALNGADAGATSDMRPILASESVVRRLTPTECERLQGFSDGYTLVPYRGGVLSDSQRYAALGNSMAVPVIRWIGKRIETAIRTNQEKPCAKV